MVDRLPLRDAMLDALAVLFPVDCAGCGAADRALCASCRAALAGPTTRRRLADGTPVVSAMRYEGVARRAILGFKEQGRTDLARPLGTRLAEAIGAAVSGPVELAPLPPSRGSLRRRGYDPVALLLRASRLPSAAVLRRAGAGAAQKTLGRESRRSNAAGSLVARRDAGGRRFLLVDDVTTTGATIGEAARVLREAGAEVIGAATVAFTPKAIGSGRDFTGIQ